MLESNRVSLPNSPYFDGRKDTTFKFEKTAHGRCRRRKVKEEHISIMAEPGSKFLGHSTPISGHAVSIVNSIVGHINSKDISLDETSSIGCDGTSVNTGHKGGVIRLLELKLQRPLQWLVCLLHFNELLMKHMMEEKDGPTNGPSAYKGPIGKLLPSSHLLPVVDFQPISVEHPPVRRHRNPSSNLITLASFAMLVYVPQWFDIKRRPSCKEGARPIFKAIGRSRYLPKPYICVGQKVIQTNAFFAHYENVLVAMLFDDRKHVRLHAVSPITKARVEKSGTLRKFKNPKINFDATDYTQMITWPRNITVPPVLREVRYSVSRIQGASPRSRNIKNWFR
ncbi:hypothetical protein FOCC_FOCC002076, partial [Frankliniella occidentalis]